MYRKLVFVTAPVLLTLVTGSPAVAQDIVQRLTRVVSYHDLNLTRPADVKTFHRRLTRAVNFVCRYKRPGDPLLGAEDNACRKQAMSDVQPKVLNAIAKAESRAANIELAAR
jgi:UrcA family protein